MTATTTVTTVHKYSHRSSKVTTKHVTPKHHELTKAQKANLLYGFH